MTLPLENHPNHDGDRDWDFDEGPDPPGIICPECNGRGRALEGWPCEACDGNGEWP